MSRLRAITPSGPSILERAFKLVNELPAYSILVTDGRLQGAYTFVSMVQYIVGVGRADIDTLSTMAAISRTRLELVTDTSEVFAKASSIVRQINYYRYAESLYIDWGTVIFQPSMIHDGGSTQLIAYNVASSIPSSLTNFFNSSRSMSLL